MIKKIFFLSISAVLLASAGNIKADTAGLTAGTASGNPGAEVIIPINLSGISAGTASIVNFDLTYDPAVLSFPSGDINKVVKGDILASANVSALTGETSHAVSITLIEMNDPLFGVIPGGQILKVKFKILSTAPAGNTSITFSNLAVIDKNSQKLTITANSGTITVNSSPVAPDTTAPAAVTNFSSSDTSQTSADFSWIAPGDDGNTGAALSYDVRYSTTAITAQNWSQATQVHGEPIPKQAGGQEHYVVVGLSADTNYYFAVKAADEAGNTSALSNIVSFKTFGTGSGDVISPASPKNFQAMPSESQISLSWVNPADSDFIRVKILRTESDQADPNCPNSPSDTQAKTVYEGNGQQYADINLNNNSNYCYAIFAYDKTPNYSIATFQKVKPQAGQSPVDPEEGNGGCAKYAGVKTFLSTSGSEVNIISLCEASPVSARSERSPLNQTEIDIYKRLSVQIKDFGKLDNSGKYSVAYFIHDGTPTTKILGAGERGGVISSYYQAFNKMPQTADDWADVIKIANGRWPSEKNEVRENKIKTEIFKTIYKRNPNMANSKDNAAVTVITYGLRPAQRNTNSEKNAILTFKAIYKRSPQSSQDWDIVRAVAYSGATR